MKKIFKFLLWLVVLAIFAVVGYVLYLRYFVNLKRFEAFNAVPKDAFIIVETSDLFKAYDQLTQSDLWKHLLKTEYFADIARDLENTDKYLRSTHLPESFFKDRKLIVSLHTIGSTWDLLYIADLKDLGKISRQLDPVLSNVPGYKTFKIRYSPDKKHNFVIYKLVYLKNQYEKLYVSLTNNLLIFSYNLNLVKKSINSLNGKHWQTDTAFQEIVKTMPGRGLFKIYVNFHYLDDFVGTFQSHTDDIVKLLSEGLNYAVFDLDFQNNMLSLEGYAGADTQTVYLSTLLKMQPALVTGYEIMSDHTAAALSLNFKDYADFYDNLMKDYAKQYPQEAKDIEKALNALEKISGININEDIFSWIGDEIWICKLSPDFNERAEDLVIIIRPTDIDLAKDRLNTLMKKLKKVTPFKFKTINYKGYEISYLQISGFFNLFFGKLFKDIDKPYYTFIDDYVVFSNAPIVLERVIDDYITGYTLRKEPKFRDFMAEFASKANFTTFIITPTLYQTLYYYANAEDKRFLRENKELINSFYLIGLQLISKKDKFKILVKAKYDPDIKLEFLVHQLEKETEIERLLQQIDSLEFKIKLNDTLPGYSGEITIYYPGTKNIHYEGKIQNGQPVGLWRAYYKSGNLQMTQLFGLNGRLTGIVQFFYDNKSNSKLAEFPIEDDIINGTLIEYYPNGAKKAEIQYKDGKKNGKAYYYYPSGKIKILGNYKDGKKHGKWTYYDEQGNVLAKEIWKNGVRNR